ncbi:MAG: hypothetical protein KKA07_11330, partial [Bacteroidetes bacterium]|nr:hypothetical protein [Bacteroidota bacterium]
MSVLYVNEKCQTTKKHTNPISRFAAVSILTMNDDCFCLCKDKGLGWEKQNILTYFPLFIHEK